MRLLRRLIRLYSILSIGVLVVGIPVFYVSLRAFVNHEIDEKLIARKMRVEVLLRDSTFSRTLARYPFVEDQLTIRLDPSATGNAPDRYDELKYYDTVIQEVAMFRRLRGQLQSQGKYYQVLITEPIVNRDELIGLVIAVQIVLLVMLIIGFRLINKNVSKLYLVQKEFTENAAHEMQTPLAVFQSKLELLMQTEPIHQGQADLINEMANASQRMNRLNRGLVLLTRIQNDQFANTESMNWGTLISELLTQYDDAIAQKEITVSLTESSPLVKASNKVLVELLISNLLSNAIRHNICRGTIRIDISENELLIENTGRPRGLDTVSLFQRFKRDSADENSLGLGLEIIDKICQQQHFDIRYVYASGIHAFSIRV